MAFRGPFGGHAIDGVAVVGLAEVGVARFDAPGLVDVVAAEVFDVAGIDAQRRPEELDIVEWGALTRAWLAAT
jgi:hypothetical protein